MHDFQKAHTHRIIGSAIYDVLVIMGLLMIAGFIAVGLNHFVTGNEAIESHNVFFQIYLLLIIVGYFLYFWKKSGQTVGMKAWRIKLISTTDVTSISISRLLLRLITAIPAYGLLMIGVFWQYLGKSKLNWQDITSHTQLVFIPKAK